MNSLMVLEIMVALLLILLSLLAIFSKKLITAIIYLSIVSMLAVLSFALMKAPDVAITEAVIGSGLVTAVFLFTLFSMRKEGEKE
ncbi:MAG: sodium:proton antiporter [delta proteobacterium ML8_F1]|nr:MAG: sodium:proton antiporter [delta proteobacterium ML8_F1]